MPLNGLWASILLAYASFHIYNLPHNKISLSTLQVSCWPKGPNCQHDMARGKGREWNTTSQTQLIGHRNNRSKQDVVITSCLR